MRLSSLPAIALLSAAAALLGGCELLVTVDRDAIGHGAGGAPTTGSTTGTAGSNSGGAPGGACIYPFDCPGTDTDCVARTCTDGHCGLGPVAADTPTSTQAAGDCMRQVCDGQGNAKLVEDDLDVPTDGNPCTDDVCVSGVPSNGPSIALTACSLDGGKVCDGAGLCVACVTSAECAGGLCVDNACISTMCLDQTRDGTETDIDCGGPSCPACGPGKACLAAADCQSDVCSGAPALCQPPSCGDAQKNGDETDVDCGGACPSGCGAGQGCASDTDCTGGACSASLCQSSCTDGEKHGAETGVDCGGGGCPPCAAGQGCVTGTDCASGVCAGSVCVAPASSCSAPTQNGTETDVGCGGPSCPPCAAGKACLAAADCASGRCVAGACAPLILISQIRSRGAAGTHDEFVELYNPGPTSVTLDAGWTLSTRSAIGLCADDGAKVLFTGAGQLLPAHGHLLLAGADYTELPAPDAALADAGLADAASVVLSQAAAVVDALCYAYDTATLTNLTGCSLAYTCEGTPAGNLPHDNTESAASTVDAALERKPGGALGNGADTGVSSADFRAVSPATPRSSLSPPAP